jgi:hypothetical protein
MAHHGAAKSSFVSGPVVDFRAFVALGPGSQHCYHVVHAEHAPLCICMYVGGATRPCRTVRASIRHGAFYPANVRAGYFIRRV